MFCVEWSVVLERVGEGIKMLKLIRKRERNWLGHWLRRNCLPKDDLEGMVNGKRVHGRRRYQMIDNIMINELYEDTKRKAEKRIEWRILSLQWETCPWAEHYDWLIELLLGLEGCTDRLFVWLPSKRYRVDSRPYPRKFSGSIGSGTGCTQPHEDNWYEK